MSPAMRIVQCAGAVASLVCAARDVPIFPHGPNWTSFLWGMLAVVFLYRLSRRRRSSVRIFHRTGHHRRGDPPEREE